MRTPVIAFVSEPRVKRVVERRRCRVVDLTDPDDAEVLDRAFAHDRAGQRAGNPARSRIGLSVAARSPVPASATGERAGRGAHPASKSNKASRHPFMPGWCRNRAA